jgi:hypothetical protein
VIRFAAALAALALSAPLPGAAQEQRPSEEELFGAPPKEEKPPPAPKETPHRGRAQGQPDEAAPERAGDRGAQPHRGPRQDDDRDQELLGSTGSPNAVPPPQGIISREKEDPLRVGGLLYLRAQVFSQEDTAPGDFRLVSPNLLDVFLDVRPNDRVRGFALGRLSYDPTLDSGASPLPGVPPAVVQALGVSQQNPRGNLDQLWVNFDVGHTVFVTAGKQHVKWGVGRLWNPTDFLHREPRNPLDPFDVRTGVTMVKAHLPWEARGWNLYGVALLEDPRYGGGSAAGKLAGVPAGGRAEIVLGTVELGADALAGKGARPRWGVDVSAGVGDFDLHAEAAFGAARARWRVVNPSADPLLGRYALVQPEGPSPQVVAGGTWAHKYSDQDSVTVGAEYFFQDSGYTDPHVYPFLFFGAPALGPTGFARQDPSAFTSFHLGRHYAGAFVDLPSPGSWNDTTFTLSALGNLSDKSGVIRLDHSVLVLTYLRVETFVQGHVGAKGGEFRLGFTYDLPPLAAPLGISSIAVKAPVVDAGIALRVSL